MSISERISEVVTHPHKIGVVAASSSVVPVEAPGIELVHIISCIYMILLILKLLGAGKLARALILKAKRGIWIEKK